jgi:hypothetical protein
MLCACTSPSGFRRLAVMRQARRRSGLTRGCQNGGLSSPVVHGGQSMVIFIHEFIHELLHTITGNAHFGDYGAR